MEATSGLQSATEKVVKGHAPGPSAGAVRSRLPARLVGVTATGPVYLGQRRLVLVPVASAFATLQELAIRVDDPKAAVTASIARRVNGDEAYAAWLKMSASCAAQLATVTLDSRLKFLRFLLSYIARAGRIDGLEPLLATAINAAWPAMSTHTLSSTLSVATAKFRKSRFAAKHAIPVLDVNRRVAGIFGAGELTKLDTAEWQAQRNLGADGDARGYLPDGIGGKLDDALKSPLERAIDQLFGGSGDGALDDAAAGLMSGQDTKGVPGGLPSAGDLPGQKGKRGRTAGSVDDIAAALAPNPGSDGVPGGLPGIGDLPGRNGAGRNLDPGDGFGQSKTSASDLLGSIPGSEYGGVSGFLRKHGTNGFKTGIFDGATPGGPFAPPGQLGIDGGGDSDPEGGGGGNPTQLPDYDDHGGGNPTTMPDYDGHGGGTPNTIFGKSNGGASIWDENFGGHGPTVRPQLLTVTALVGPGLLADVVQVGRAAIRY